MYSKFIAILRVICYAVHAVQPVGCDGVLGSDKRIDNCGRCDATEGICLHVPCNIEKVDEPENGTYVAIPNRMKCQFPTYRILHQTSCWIHSC